MLSESQRFSDGFTLEDGHLPAAVDGMALLMTVNGVPTTIAPGTYAGEIDLIVYPLAHVPEDQAELSVGDFRTAIYIKDGVMQPTALSSLAGDVRENGHTLQGVSLSTNIDDFNGIIVAGDNGDEPYVIDGSHFRANGGGTSEGRGACLMTVGTANVKLDGAEIRNHGTPLCCRHQRSQPS